VRPTPLFLLAAAATDGEVAWSALEVFRRAAARRRPPALVGLGLLRFGPAAPVMSTDYRCERVTEE
jgi:hypothetical protein